MIISLTIVTFYASFVKQADTGQIENPSIVVYRQLASQYGDTVSCPCTQMAIVYDTFISTTPVSIKQMNTERLMLKCINTANLYCSSVT